MSQTINNSFVGSKTADHAVPSNTTRYNNLIISNLNITTPNTAQPWLKNISFSAKLSDLKLPPCYIGLHDGGQTQNEITCYLVLAKEEHFGANSHASRWSKHGVVEAGRQTRQNPFEKYNYYYNLNFKNRYRNKKCMVTYNEDGTIKNPLVLIPSAFAKLELSSDHTYMQANNVVLSNINLNTTCYKWFNTFASTQHITASFTQKLKFALVIAVQNFTNEQISFPTYTYVLKTFDNVNIEADIAFT